MINNFKQIKELMDFPNDGDFYFLQLIQRKKDKATEANGNNNSRLVKAYYISSTKQLDDLEEEIIILCDALNARAYINLNRRNYEKCSLQTARLILDQLANKDHKSAKKAFNTVCGRYHSDTDKKWLLDYDKGELTQSQIGEIRFKLSGFQPIGEKFISLIPTKNGYHIITKPFNLKESESLFGKFELDAHKNNPTVLYVK